VSAHTRQTLIEAIVDEYYASDLPEEPAARARVLRDIVQRRWSAMPVNERITLAEEFDDAEALTAFAEQAAPELDEQAVDGLTELVRHEIPELSVPEF
jgi:class 3 adenylate cyclase